jgi:hypothetical protein
MRIYTSTPIRFPYHLDRFCITHVAETASLNKSVTYLYVFASVSVTHLQLQVPWEVDNTVCSSDDVTVVD